MNERIKTLRKKLNLTQQEFADKIGIKRGAIANYEIGRNIPIDAVITLICTTFDVNEEWLRNGTGEMFVEKTRNQIITDFMGDLIMEPESFKTRLIEGLAKLDETDWEDIEKIILKIVDKKES